MNKQPLSELIPAVAMGAAHQTKKLGWRIVVISGGWVIVGLVEDMTTHLTVHNSQCIRVWGTVRGLGQLVSGPLPGTTLDPIGMVQVPSHAVLFLIEVSQEIWAGVPM